MFIESTMVSSIAPASAQSPRAPRSGHVFSSSAAVGNSTRWLERPRVGPRRPTPDSEALASSDDELDRQHRLDSFSPQAGATSGTTRPARRPSWLAEAQQQQQQPPPSVGRKSSVAGASSVSPMSSQPNSPSVEPPAWSGAGVGTSGAIGRTAAATASASPFIWSSAIWNNDARKDAPSRLAEVLPSPTTDGMTRDEPDPSNDASSRDLMTESASIPFAIPLHPTPKSYRSQSYSVGQLDLDVNGILSRPLPATAALQARVKSSQPSGLQHRPSRPSMLSELTRDSTSLDQVRESDDDADEAADEDDDFAAAINGARRAGRHASDAAAIGPLRQENVQWRQAAGAMLRGRANGNAAVHAISASSVPLAAAQRFNHPIQGSVPEESDYAVDEVDDVDELHAFTGRGLNARRYSEFGTEADGRFSSLAFAEHRKIESLKKGYWQSSLGFGGHSEGLQSRRHSFADVPARSGSVSSNADQHLFAHAGAGAGAGAAAAAATAAAAAAAATAAAPADSDPGKTRQSLMDKSGRLAEPNGRAGRADQGFYFTATAASHPTRNPMPQPSVTPANTYPSAVFGAPSPYGSDRAQSPLSGLPRAAFAAPPHLASLAPSRPSQPLYLVTFKCCRADVFYLQEGTGLQVKAGDMVIVEADRGTDLGTVVNANISMEQAKELKEHYTEEHYKCLMMFSRHAAQAGHVPGRAANGLASASAVAGSAIGGMGPSGAHAGGHDAPSVDLRPKLIKRLAQPHEIQTLRDKEGNEAKAKRVCQQKVAEHRLQMEILDAEFQMDWKKLTFYYFADTYINFNSLVTELFKVYKTRIWMSAIGRQSPSRPAHDNPFNGTGSVLNGFASAYAPSVETGPVGDVSAAGMLPPPYTYGFHPFRQLQRPPVPVMDNLAFAAPRSSERPIEFRAIEFGDLGNVYARRPVGHETEAARDSPLAHRDGWMANFQSLSLGSH